MGALGLDARGVYATVVQPLDAGIGLIRINHESQYHPQRVPGCPLSPAKRKCGLARSGSICRNLRQTVLRGFVEMGGAAIFSSPWDMRSSLPMC